MKTLKEERSTLLANKIKLESCLTEKGRRVTELETQLEELQRELKRNEEEKNGLEEKLREKVIAHETLEKKHKVWRYVTGCYKTSAYYVFIEIYL